MNNLPQEKLFALNWIDGNRARMSDFNVRIWNFAETAWREYKSSQAYVDLLRAEGFDVEQGSGGMPTAFAATWGKGEPVLGSLSEYDAVPGNSQQAVPYRAPREGLHPWAPGHTDPHSSLGTTALTGILATKAAMQAFNLPGTLKLFGEPAEKVCGSKAVHADQGLFRQLRRLRPLSSEMDQHRAARHAVRLVLERGVHLRDAASRALDRQGPRPGLARPRRRALSGRDRCALPHVHEHEIHQGGDVPAHRLLERERVHHGRRRRHLRQPAAALQPRSNTRGARPRSRSSSRSTTSSRTTRSTPPPSRAARSRCAGSPRRAPASSITPWPISRSRT